MPRILTIIAALLLLLSGSVAAQRSNAVYLPLIRNDTPPTATPTATPEPQPTPVPPPPTPTPMPDPRAGCDPSYPTLCLPTGVGDTVNCSDIFQRNFPVLPPDPHRLDTDKDGVGCESR